MNRKLNCGMDAVRKAGMDACIFFFARPFLDQKGHVIGESGGQRKKKDPGLTVRARRDDKLG